MLDLISVPFGYLMRFCYSFTGNYAIALIFFTLLFKLILLPLSIKQQKSARDRARIQPKERAIRKRYVGRTDQNAQIELNNDIMKLYRDEKVSMTSGCLPMLIQLPIIAALYQIVTKPLQYISMLSTTTVDAVKNRIFELFTAGTLNAENTSAQIFNVFNSASGDVAKFGIDQIQMSTVINAHSGSFSEIFPEGIPLIANFGTYLAARPTFTSIVILIPILSALFQLASSFILQLTGPKPDASSPEAAQLAKQMRTMNFIFPAMTFFIALSVPAIIGLYWIYQTVFGVIINVVLTRLYPVPVFTPEDFEKAEEEMNKNYIPPAITSQKRRSLHSIDDDEEETTTEENEAESDGPEEEAPALPPRRRVDKDGNPIRSLHYIDEEDEPLEKDEEQ